MSRIDASQNNRVDECVYRTKSDCRGCEYSYNPKLFDGGCKLHYENIKNNKNEVKKAM